MPSDVESPMYATELHEVVFALTQPPAVFDASASFLWLASTPRGAVFWSGLSRASASGAGCLAWRLDDVVRRHSGVCWRLLGGRRHPLLSAAGSDHAGQAGAVQRQDAERHYRHDARDEPAPRACSPWKMLCGGATRPT